MKFSLSNRPLDQQTKDACIVFVHNKKALIQNDGLLAELIAQQIKSSRFNGEFAQIQVFPTLGKSPVKNIILTGIGNCDCFQAETIERATAAAVRSGRKANLCSFVAESGTVRNGLSCVKFVHAVARGAAWGTYHFNTFKTQKKQAAATSLTFAGPCDDSTACRAELTAAEHEATALFSTANLANLPGNIATPQHIADHAQKIAQETGLSCSVLDKPQLQKQNCNALLAVAAGSDQDAKIITLKYEGTDKDAKPVVLVGKTITFDSGGISLKPGKGMSWMLYDKCGGMAVLAAMHMIALLKPKNPVVGILTVAENMPGGGATRPGDIVTSRSGQTIEILNTDAEGRLALCDALDLAREHNPAAIVDLATLTGACIVALGHTASAILGNDAKLTEALIQSGNRAGERLWELPLWKEHMDDIKGTFADLQNIGKSGTAGTITAGAFLKYFVPDNIPWAHIDIAGTAWEEAPKAWAEPGATLFGARTLIEWIQNMDTAAE